MKDFKFNFNDLIGMQKISDQIYLSEGLAEQKVLYRDLHSLCLSCNRLRFKEFFKESKAYSSGVRKDCNECLDKKRSMIVVSPGFNAKEYNRSYYEENRDKILDQKRLYNEKNREKKKKYDKKRYLIRKNLEN
jgi:hypothetical protein